MGVDECMERVEGVGAGCDEEQPSHLSVEMAARNARRGDLFGRARAEPAGSAASMSQELAVASRLMGGSLC